MYLRISYVWISKCFDTKIPRHKETQCSETMTIYSKGTLSLLILYWPYVMYNGCKVQPYCVIMGRQPEHLHTGLLTTIEVLTLDDPMSACTPLTSLHMLLLQAHFQLSSTYFRLRSGCTGFLVTFQTYQKCYHIRNTLQSFFLLGSPFPRAPRGLLPQLTKESMPMPSTQ